QASLNSFPIEFRQGMAARAAILHDFGANAPANWEYPFGTADMHIALAIYAQNEQSLQQVLELARKSLHDLPQISVVYRMQFGSLPEGRNAFGFKDGLHNPVVEGSSPGGQIGNEAPINAGEFVMGYPDESGETAQTPIPDELRHNGTFAAFRKFHMDVAGFRRRPEPQQRVHLRGRHEGIEVPVQCAHSACQSARCPERRYRRRQSPPLPAPRHELRASSAGRRARG